MPFFHLLLERDLFCLQVSSGDSISFLQSFMRQRCSLGMGQVVWSVCTNLCLFHLKVYNKNSPPLFSGGKVPS